MLDKPLSLNSIFLCYSLVSHGAAGIKPEEKNSCRIFWPSDWMAWEQSPVGKMIVPLVILPEFEERLSEHTP